MHSLSKSVASIKTYPTDSRLTTYPIPINRKLLWKMYEDARKCIWVPGEIKFGLDREHYDNLLTPQQKHFVDHVLAFFASFDGLVNMNLAERFMSEVDILEAKYFYRFQMAMEDIHAETYSLLLDTIIADADNRAHLLNSIDTMPIIKKMADFARKWIHGDASFAARLIGMAAVEGIFFSGCFCAIYWLGNRGVMPGLCHSNELIARDERNHTVFATMIYTLINSEDKLQMSELYEIIIEAVMIAKEFINEALPVNLPEMNANLMGKYIECVSDNLLSLVDTPPLYNSPNPFGFMEQLNLPNKTNFFERFVSEYQKQSTCETSDFEIAETF